MLNKNEIFSFTFLFNDENDKLILISEGEVPPKTEEEADTVLDSKLPDEKDIVDTIIEKITVFREAEPGSEPTVTDTLLELQNKYGISLEEDLEDKAGIDLENETDEQQDEDSLEKEKQEDGRYHLGLLTDPTAILPEAIYRYTNPNAFLDEDVDDEEYTRPEMIIQNDDILEEEMKDLGDCSGKDCEKRASVLAKVKGKKQALCDDCYKAAKKALPKEVMIAESASISDAIHTFIKETIPGQKYYSKDVKEIFQKLTIFGSADQSVILRTLAHTGNIEIKVDEEGNPFLLRTSGSSIATRTDEHAIAMLVDPTGNAMGNINLHGLDSNKLDVLKRPKFLRTNN